ncbi:OmpA family protein, partial [Belliella marina]
MKKVYKSIIIFLLAFGFLHTVDAQNQMLRYADQQVELGNFNHAAEVFSQAFDRRNTYRSAKGAALSFDKINDYENSYQWWNRVIDFSSEIDKEDVESYLLSAYLVGKQDLAKDKLSTLGYAIEELEDSKLEMILASFSSSSKMELEYVSSLNYSLSADYTGAKDKEGNIYFVSDRDRVAEGKSMPLLRFDAKNKIFDKNIYDWTGREYLKIYKKDDEGNIEEIQVDGQRFLHMSDPALAKINGQDYLFFSATRDITKKKKTKSLTVHPELFFGKLDGNVITDVRDFPLNNVFTHSLITPFVDQENKRLYFSSDIEGGVGGFDIYFVEFDEDFVFSEPINIGEEINSNGNERDPFIYENKLFFSSDGHEGFGGFDIFQADSKGDGIFFNLSNLEAPINSIKDDFGYKKFDKEEVYLSSNRLGNSGLDNIYKLVLQLRQLLVRVVDCDGELVMDYDLQVVENQGNKLDMKLNDKGEYIGDLEADTDYMLNLAKGGHFPVEDHSITTVDMEPGIIERNYRLIRIPSDMIVYTDIIYYNLDKSDIRRDADQIIDKVHALMEKYKFLDLKVSSHTDSRASHEYNEALSKRRAEAV